MSAAQINQLLNAVGPSNVLAFFLVLVRVAPLFVIAPLFSSSYLPPQVRTAIAVGLAMGLTGIAAHGQQIPTGGMQVVGLVLEQLLVGGALAFALAAMFAAVQAAGSILDAVAGFSFGAMLNPLTGTQDAILSQLYALVGTAVFVAFGGDGWVLRGVEQTFRLVPLTGTVAVDSIVGGSVSMFTTICTAALELAAPVMLAVIITDIAFGMLSRVVPQLNVFAVGFPVRVGVAIIAVTISLPFLGGWLGDQISGSLGTALRELGAV
ncbi:MAG: flagellar biosynthetic protein FliR [Solirubrobacteraceae bacterium]|jgi:flagellar biosynthetic protein FliR